MAVHVIVLAATVPLPSARCHVAAAVAVVVEATTTLMSSCFPLRHREICSSGHSPPAYARRRGRSSKAFSRSKPPRTTTSRHHKIAQYRRRWSTIEDDVQKFLHRRCIVQRRPKPRVAHRHAYDLSGVHVQGPAICHAQLVEVAAGSGQPRRPDTFINMSSGWS